MALMVKDLAPANDETAPTLKRVNSKFVKAEAEQTGYVEDSYIGVKGYFLDIWRNNFVSRLTRVVLITFCLYGLNQGGVHAFNELGRVYSYKDRGYEPAETQRAIAYTDMSWNLKPLFALCFDALPLFGYHFKSYLLFWGLLGSTAYGLIAAIPKALSDAVFTFLLWAGMNSVVWNDIAIDGMTVQKMKRHKHVDTELQSFQVFTGIVVSIFTSFSSGFIIDAIGLQWLYAIVCLIAVIATIACLLLDEKRDLTARLSFVSFWRDLKNAFSAFRDKVYLNIFLYTAVVSFSFQLSGVMIYWYDDVAKYSKGFQGAANTASWVIALIFIILYTSYMKHWNYRTNLLNLQILVTAVSALDIILVGVAKSAFWGHFIALSDRAGQRIQFRLTTVVMLVAVADHMPDNAEATAMGFLMAISNITGGDLLSPLAGSWLLDGLGVKRGAYDNLVWAVTIRTVARLIPIPFIYLLIPSGSSRDKVRDKYDLDDLESAKQVEMSPQVDTSSDPAPLKPAFSSDEPM